LKYLIINEFVYYYINCRIDLVYYSKNMKRKTEKQLNKELIEYIVLKKLPPQKARMILRAYFEKHIYAKTRKLH
jgi:hypothetical protein